MPHRWLAFLVLSALTVVVFIFFVMRLRPVEIPEPAAKNTVGTLDEPTVTFVNPSRGSRDAKVTIVEFADFECEACAMLATTLEAILKTYPQDVRLVWKDLPNESIHPMATPAAIAAHCAGRQDAFWQFHDALFKRQGALSESRFQLIASELGLDEDKFKACYDERDTLPIVRKDFDEGIALGIPSTPAIYVGDKLMIGAVGLAQVQEAIEAALASP